MHLVLMSSITFPFDEMLTKGNAKLVKLTLKVKSNNHIKPCLGRFQTLDL